MAEMTKPCENNDSTGEVASSQNFGDEKSQPRPSSAGIDTVKGKTARARKLNQTLQKVKRQKAESRQSALRLAFSGMVTTSAVMWDAIPTRDAGFQSGIESAVLWSAAFPMLDVVQTSFSSEAKGPAVQFLAAVLKGEKCGDVTDHDVNRTYQRNLKETTELVCGDISEVVEAGDERKDKNSVERLERLYALGERVLHEAVMVAPQATVFSLLSVSFTLSTAIAYAAVARSQQELVRTHDDVLNHITRVHQCWMKKFMDPNILVDESKGVLLDYKAGVEDVFRVILVQRLFKLLWEMTLEVGLGQYLPHRAVGRDGFHQLQGRLQRLFRSSFPHQHFLCRSESWYKILHVLQQLLKIAVDDCKEDRFGKEDVIFHLYTSPLFNTKQWQLAKMGAETRKQTLSVTLQSLSRSLSDFQECMLRWTEGMEISEAKAAGVQGAAIDRQESMAIDDLVFHRARDILTQFFQYQHGCMELSNQLLAIEETTLRSLVPEANGSHEIVVNDNDTSLWINRMYCLLTYTMIGQRISGRILPIYENSIVSLFLGRINSVTGKRLRRG